MVTFMPESASTGPALPASTTGRRGPAATVGGGGKDIGQAGPTGQVQQKAMGQQTGVGVGGEKPRHQASDTSSTQEVRELGLTG